MDAKDGHKLVVHVAYAYRGEVGRPLQKEAPLNRDLGEGACCLVKSGDLKGRDWEGGETESFLECEEARLGF